MDTLTIILIVLTATLLIAKHCRFECSNSNKKCEIAFYERRNANAQTSS